MIKYKRDFMKYYDVTIADVLLCECGKISTELHHKVSKGQGGSDHPTNLKPICRECHIKIHG